VPIEALRLTGTNAANYRLDIPPTDVDVLISRRPLTVTADDKSRVFGVENPAFTFSYTGLVTGEDADAITSPPTATTTAVLDSPPGSYPITPSGGGTTDNYVFIYVDGTLTVLEKAPINDWDNTDVDTVEVSNSDFDGEHYVLWCDMEGATVTVTPANKWATVSYQGILAVNNAFYVSTPKPGIYPVTYTVTAPSGAQQEYTIILERRFAFYDLISEKWGNLLVVDNIPEKNLGYEFLSYQWYHNNAPISGETGQYYSAGENDETDKLGDVNEYYVEIMLVDGTKLRTCAVQIDATPQNASLRAYPNPIKQGETLKITLPVTENQTDRYAEISVYSIRGTVILRQQATSPTIELKLNVPTGIYIIRVNGQSTKIVVE
jgi:hypothetical protein